jgi:hypothetical protein
MRVIVEPSAHGVLYASSLLTAPSRSTTTLSNCGQHAGGALRPRRASTALTEVRQHACKAGSRCKSRPSRCWSSCDWQSHSSPDVSLSARECRMWLVARSAFRPSRSSFFHRPGTTLSRSARLARPSPSSGTASSGGIAMLWGPVGHTGVPASLGRVRAFHFGLLGGKSKPRKKKRWRRSCAQMGKKPKQSCEQTS